MTPFAYGFLCSLAAWIEERKMQRQCDVCRVGLESMLRPQDLARLFGLLDIVTQVFAKVNIKEKATRRLAEFRTHTHTHTHTRARAHTHTRTRTHPLTRPLLPTYTHARKLMHSKSTEQRRKVRSSLVADT